MSAVGNRRFTVLLPITRPPVFLPYAVDSVLAQTHADFELFIVSDGAPAATVAWGKAAEARDPRIRLFDFPKGERHGEAHRHVALEQATGASVAQIADDDLWFPDFLSEMAAHLETVDFGNLVHCNVGTDGKLFGIPGDLASPATRERMLRSYWNLFGPTVAGYRLSAYRQLAEGWSPAPPDIATDLHMWRKFLRDDRLTVGTRFAIESLRFPTPQRTTWSEAEREREIGDYARRIRDAATRRTIAAEGFRMLYALTKAEVVAQVSAHVTAVENERNLLKARLQAIESRLPQAGRGVFPVSR